MNKSEEAGKLVSPPNVLHEGGIIDQGRSPENKFPEGPLARSATMTREEWRNSTTTEILEHAIRALDSDPVSAVRQLLRKLHWVSYPPKRSDVKTLELVAPHLPQIAKIAMEDATLHGPLSKIILRSSGYYGLEFLDVVLQQGDRGVPMPPGLESQLLESLRMKRHIDIRGREVLAKHMPTIVSEALRNPSYHKKLLELIRHVYKRNESREYDEVGKLPTSTLVEQIALQVIQRSEESSGVVEFAAKLTDALCNWQRGDNFHPDKFPGNLWIDINNIAFKHREQIGEFLRTKGVDPDILHSHATSYYSEMLSTFAIAYLEHKKAGICSGLQARFGINSFHRYSSEFLMNLDEQGDDTDINKRVLIVVASHDHNGAFFNPDEYRKYLELKTFGIEPILFEVNSLEELAALVEQRDPAILETVFQMLIIAHGKSDRIHLGYDGSNRDKGRYINNENMSQFEEIFRHMPYVANIILDSCSTGKEINEPSIARIMSESLGGLPVDALRIPTSSENSVGRKGIKHKPKPIFQLRFGPQGRVTINLKLLERFAKVSYSGHRDPDS